jgi:hypothetical protein
MANGRSPRAVGTNFQWPASSHETGSTFIRRRVVMAAAGAPPPGERRSAGLNLRQLGHRAQELAAEGRRLISFANGLRADACGFADGLRRLPALNLLYNSHSTVRRQTGIPVHVHPVLPYLKSQQPQLPRSQPDGQPTKSSHQCFWAHDVVSPSIDLSSQFAQGF